MATFFFIHFQASKLKSSSLLSLTTLFLANMYPSADIKQGIPMRPAPHSDEWSTGLCDCFSDCSTCCLTCWCPCITFGRIAEIVDRGSPSCIASGALYTLLGLFTGCACIYSCCYRSKMKQQYGFPENTCGDCCVHFCCEACALCQEYRELQHRGFDMAIGWEGNVRQKSRGVEMAPSVEAGMRRF